MHWNSLQKQDARDLREAKFRGTHTSGLKARLSPCHIDSTGVGVADVASDRLPKSLSTSICILTVLNGLSGLKKMWSWEGHEVVGSLWLIVKEESCVIFGTCPAVQGQWSYFILSIFINMQDDIPVGLDREIWWDYNAHCSDLRFKGFQHSKYVLTNST